MSNFFWVNNKWVTTRQMRKVRELRDREAATFCHYCSSTKIRHMAKCPTRQPGFDPETAVKMTWEQRQAEILARQKTK